MNNENVPLLTAEQAKIVMFYDPSTAHPQLRAIADGRAVVIDAAEHAALRAENDNLLDRLTHANATHDGLYIANERLRARVAELESHVPRVAILHPEPFPTLVADAGPTPYQGRTTRREE